MSLYVVLFEKKTSLKKAGFTPLIRPDSLKCQSWVSMGHFDAIHTYTLLQEGANPFPLIQKNNSWLAEQDGDKRHFHPLYLISNSEGNAFWDRTSNFIAVSRIHFSRTTGANEVYEQLMQKLDDLDPKGETFHLYRTIELCDAVLVGKSNSLYHLLDVTLTLRKHPGIGRVYTYCAISNSFLNLEELPSANETIPLCTIRFAVASFPNAQKELNAIKHLPALRACQPHFVIGVDDIVMFWTDMSVESLLWLYRHWFTGTEENTLDAAFSSMTTRLGIEAPDTENWPDPKKDENLQQLSAELNAMCKSIVQKQGDIHPAWLRPLSELTYSLVRLSRMPVLDEFAYLMLPGVHAFLKRLNEGTSPDHNAYQHFVESWISVMEHIMRGEGQLTQYPQLRPAVFDIPVAMLEYILAFLDCAASLLRKGDKKKTQIALFPVPGLYQRISATELFPPENALPGLVLIEIPLEMLYNPLEMQKALCHELSHFIGETIRCRAERTARYSKASAVLIADHLFSFNHNALAISIDSQLNKYLKEKTTIETMEAAVLTWVRDFRCSEKNTSILTAAILNNYDPKDYHLAYLPDLMRKGKNANETNFILALRDLSILFRECFADLCMLYLLPVEPLDYVKSLLDDLSIPSEKQEKPYEQIAIRIYAVLRANSAFKSEQIIELFDSLSQRLSSEETTEGSNFWNLKEEMLHLIIQIQSDKEAAVGRRIPIGAVSCLRDYTKLCYKSLSMSISDEDKKDLCKMFQNTTSSENETSSPMDYDDFMNRVDAYRRKLQSSQ